VLFPAVTGVGDPAPHRRHDIFSMGSEAVIAGDDMRRTRWLQGTSARRYGPEKAETAYYLVMLCLKQLIHPRRRLIDLPREPPPKSIDIEPPPCGRRKSRTAEE
jgi:hypothetical protein